MLISLERIIKTGFQSFRRNIAPNLATIFIMIMVISFASALFLLSPISKILITDLQEKVDVSVYFKESALVDEILTVKEEISQIPEVKNIEYISKEQALEKFIERHKDDPILIESLTELGYNPFLASLNVKAHQSSQYEQVASFLETEPFKDLIEKVDYYQRKPIIDKVSSIVVSLNKFGIFLGIILGLVAFLITFNTIRIAIYNSGKEISIMRLVGASNWFIRGPFLVQGVIAGLIATLITLLIFFGICYSFNPQVAKIAPNINLIGIFFSNFWALLLIQLLTGVGLGVISSFIAIRKYLKI